MTSNAPHAVDVDTEVLARLAHELDDHDLVADIVASFLADLPLRIARGRGAAVAGDVAAASREAHSLSSASRQLGGIRLAACAAQVEHGRGSWDDLERAAHAARPGWNAWVQQVAAGADVA